MYEKNVFINCPFDDEYTGILHATTFAVVYAGFIPRSALEEVNSGEERLAKIVKLIKECGLSLHDISRVEVKTTSDMPRFNMPFECGIFYGAMSLGTSKHRKKKFLVLDSEKFRYQKTMSDIAGKDPECHNNKPEDAIGCVRRFLNSSNGGIPLPGETHFIQEYNTFKGELPAILGKMKINEAEIRKLGYWKEYAVIATQWAKERAKAA